MASRVIFEPELEGSTVVFWEAGNGARINYPTELVAETAFEFLVKVSRWYHRAKEKDWPVWVYAEFLSHDEFVARFKRIIAKFGYKVEEGLTRPASEYW